MLRDINQCHVLAPLAFSNLASAALRNDFGPGRALKSFLLLQGGHLEFLFTKLVRTLRADDLITQVSACKCFVPWQMIERFSFALQISIY